MKPTNTYTHSYVASYIFSLPSLPRVSIFSPPRPVVALFSPMRSIDRRQDGQSFPFFSPINAPLRSQDKNKERTSIQSDAENHQHHAKNKKSQQNKAQNKNPHREKTCLKEKLRGRAMLNQREVFRTHGLLCPDSCSSNEKLKDTLVRPAFD